MRRRVESLSAADIRCRLDVPVRLPAWQVRSEVRHNLFLAFKEALNNTAKHGQARKVRVSMQVGEAHFSLVLRDDGCGFDTMLNAHSPQTSGGNGLKNMRLRLEQIGGRCTIDSVSGRGTTVEFLVEVNRVHAPGAK